MEYNDLLHRCFRCGYCKLTSDYYSLNCPSYRKFRFESYASGGRLWLIRAWINGDVAWSEHLAEVLYSCATCRNCVENCIMKFKDNLVEMVVAARAEAVERGLAPPPVRDFLINIQRYGNPYKVATEAGADWARDTGMPFYAGQEYLLYVGSVGAHDERGRAMARALARLMTQAGVSVGILPQETDDGGEVRLLGESELFRQVAADNIARFQQLGVTKIVTLSPHSYHTLRTEYPQLGGRFQVFHYTQLLRQLLQQGRLIPASSSLKVTYHDPCFLGRYNREYDTPRQVMRSISGLELVEMANSRQNSFCCGGGGGNFFTDILGGGPDSPARIRVREARETGAAVLAVACPQCAAMLDDAVRDEGLEGRLAVRDVAEILRESCRS